MAEVTYKNILEHAIKTLDEMAATALDDGHPEWQEYLQDISDNILYVLECSTKKGDDDGPRGE